MRLKYSTSDYLLQLETGENEASIKIFYASLTSCAKIDSISLQKEIVDALELFFKKVEIEVPGNISEIGIMICDLIISRRANVFSIPLAQNIKQDEVKSLIRNPFLKSTPIADTLWDN